MIYSGTVSYNDADIAFCFDESKLSLFPSYEIFKEITMYQDANGVSISTSERKPFADGFLEGKVNGQPIFIHFYFNPTGYGYKSLNFSECEILIYPHDYIIYNKIPSYPLDNVTMNYKSQQMHKFLGLIPKYEVSSDLSNGLCGKISCNLSTTDMTSKGDIEDFQVSIRPSFDCSWGGTTFRFCPQLSFEVTCISNEKLLLELYHSIIFLVKYAFMRIDIHPDIFEIKTNDGLKGDIHSLNEKYETVESEDCNSIWRDSIPWYIFHKHTVDILSLIVKNNLYLDNIPKNKKERLLISDIIISKEAAAFEHEFSISYPNGLTTHSKARIEAENEVQQEIQNLLNSSHGRKKAIYKGFQSHIRNDALGDKIEFCFKQHEHSMKWLKSKIAQNMSAKQLANICVNIRNDIDHGNKLLEINSEVANAYVMLRALIYAMQLKRIGFDDDDINDAITNLFFIKGIAP